MENEHLNEDVAIDFPGVYTGPAVMRRDLMLVYFAADEQPEVPGPIVGKIGDEQFRIMGIGHTGDANDMIVMNVKPVKD